MIYDITPLVSKDLPVWPGSDHFARTIACDMHDGSLFTASSISGTCHLGAHVDAPSHYSMDGEAIHERALDFFIGKCQVIRIAVAKHSYIEVADLPKIEAPRVLFATNTFDYSISSFQTDYAAIGPKLMQHLADAGVITVGIDTPSVDFCDKDTAASHHVARDNNITLLEGIDLKGVPEGIYELIALPLKLKDCDASPVRAILRTSSRD